MKTNETVTRAPAVADSRQAWSILLWCAMGVLLPRATIYGEVAPFGIGLAAAMTAGRWPVTLAVTVGYLFAQPVALPLRYVAAVAVIGGARWVVAALPAVEKNALVPPLISLVSTLVTGLVIYGQGGLDAYRVVLVLAESVVAAGSTVFFATAMAWLHQGIQREPVTAMTAGQQAALLFVAATTAMAASTLTIEGFAPGRVVAALLVLLLARVGRQAGGCMAGCILGAAMALSTPEYTALAVALALGGLLAGALASYGRVAQGAVFFVAAGVVTLTQPGDTTLLYLYELLAAGVVFFLFPKGPEQKLARLFFGTRELPAVAGVRRLTALRLEVAATAVKDVAATVGRIAQRLAPVGAPSPAAIYQESSRAVCEGCPLHAVCWEQHRQELTAALEAMTPLLEKQGAITADQLGGYASASCRRPDRLVAYINHSYEQYVAREGAWHRLRELQEAAESQLAGTGRLLQDLAGDLTDPRQVDVELSDRVLAVCRDFGMPVSEALCVHHHGDRLTVDILTTEEGIPPEEGRWLRHMRQVCHCALTPPVVSRWEGRVRLTLTVPPRYRLEIATAQRLCDGEKLCGDAVEVFSPDGQTVALLSDGMGSGGRAAVDGAMTAALTARLWQAGFHPDGILQTVNAALQVKSREESLATLDVAAVDLFTGRLDSYKAGAATTLLYSGGRLSRIERPSLPLGILPEVVFEHSRDWLAVGDVLLMMSDGAIPQGVAPVEQMLGAWEPGESMQELADRIADAARTAQQQQDDITVIAMCLLKQ